MDGDPGPVLLEVEDKRGGLTYQRGTEAALRPDRRVIKEMRMLPTRILLTSDVSEEAYQGGMA